jgi:hypothetical protein
LRSFQLTGIPVQVKGENVTGKYGIRTKIIRAKTQTTPVSDFDVRMLFPARNPLVQNSWKLNRTVA